MSVDPEAPFDEPWQARLFALTQALLEGPDADREDFRRRLMAEIADAPDRPYWESWLAAFEGFVVDAGLTTPGELVDLGRT